LGLKKFHEIIVDAISFYFGQCDVLEAELENFKISQISATERRRAELRSFEAAVETGIVSETETEKFAGKIPTEITGNFATVLFANFFRNFLEILEGGQILETLRLDVVEIRKLQNSWICLLRLFTIAASLPALMPLGNRQVTLEQVWPLLTSDAEAEEVATLVASRSRDHLAVAAIKAAMKLDGAVADLMRRRLRKAMDDAMTSQLSGQPGEVKMGKDLTFGETKAAELLKRLIEFSADHLSVYGEYYKTKYTSRSI
jgi:hypothetical protein